MHQDPISPLPQPVVILASQSSSHSAVSDRQINYNHISYALALFSYFTAGLTWIIPIVMNYLKRDEARGTWLYSHFAWQIKTFWYSIIFGAIGGTLLVFGFGGLFFGAAIDNSQTMGGSLVMGGIGAIVLAVTIVWHLYRIARGWIALSSRRAVP